MDLLTELGVPAEDQQVFQAVRERLSYAMAAESLGYTEGRTRHRFFRTCYALQRDPRGRELVHELMQRLNAG